MYLDILGLGPVVPSSRPCLRAASPTAFPSPVPRHPLAHFWATHAKPEWDQVGCRDHFQYAASLFRWLPARRLVRVASLFRLVTPPQLQQPPSNIKYTYLGTNGTRVANAFRGFSNIWANRVWLDTSSVLVPPDHPSTRTSCFAVTLWRRLTPRISYQSPGTQGTLHSGYLRTYSVLALARFTVISPPVLQEPGRGSKHSA